MGKPPVPAVFLCAKDGHLCPLYSFFFPLAFDSVPPMFEVRQDTMSVAVHKRLRKES